MRAHTRAIGMQKEKDMVIFQHKINRSDLLKLNIYFDFNKANTVPLHRYDSSLSPTSRWH